MGFGMPDLLSIQINRAVISADFIAGYPCNLFHKWPVLPDITPALSPPRIIASG
jgi:hypothetical protein